MKKEILKTYNNAEIKKSQAEAPIISALERFVSNPTKQFHIPAHTKGNCLLEEFRNLINKHGAFLDCTDEFNNIGTLNPPTGAIKKAEDLMAEAMNGKRTFFLLNGSSIGNFAIAMTCSKPNSKVLIGRNCHRSALTGLIMTGANPVWLTPEKLDEWSIWGGVSPELIEKKLALNPDTSLVWITSPTYEGIISDIEAIADICHKRGVVLAVDEAHGALWNFSENLPKSALELGADVVVHSMHKTAGSFSQSSMLTLSKNSLVNEHLMEHSLKLLHTTSPSVMLLASLDAARAYLMSEEGQNKINKSIEITDYIKSKLRNINNVEILEGNQWLKLEPTRVYFKIKGLKGRKIENLLKLNYNIEIEASTDYGVLALCNIGTNEEDVSYLINAIREIANEKYEDLSYLENCKFMPLLEPQIIMSPQKAFYHEQEIIPTKDAVGRICAELIAECPPGIFILAPGELIKKEHLPYLENYKTLSVLK